MATTYAVEPKRIEDGMVVTPENPQDAEFYGVYVKGIRELWTVGGMDQPELSTHLRDFPSAAAAQEFIANVEAQKPQLELLEAGKPVKIAGVTYQPSTTEGMYTAEGGIAENPMPMVRGWELRYALTSGNLTPELAANAIAHPDKLTAFDQQNLLHHVQETQQDYRLEGYRKLEGTYLKALGGHVPADGLSDRVYSVEDMPDIYRAFVRNPGAAPAVEDAPKVASPMGGIDMNQMPEGTTLLYSRADSPDQLRTGVLMHNQSTATGQRLEILNDQGLRERLYTGPDQGLEGKANRLAAVVGTARPVSCDEGPLFVSGVDAAGRMTKDPNEIRSHAIFALGANDVAVPVGQAVSPELAEHLKQNIESGRVPSPADTPQTVSSLAQLRDLLDLPPAAPEAEINPSALESPAQETKATPQETKVPAQEEEKKSERQPQVVHQHISLMGLLLMHTANAGRNIARAIRGPDADALQHRAHARMDTAQRHLDAIAADPAVQTYQQMASLPNMPERAKALYADTLFRNHPHLEAHYRAAAENVEKAGDTLQQWQRKSKGQSDPELLQKASKLHETASKLPDMQQGISGGLFQSLRNFFGGERKPLLNP